MFDFLVRLVSFLLAKMDAASAEAGANKHLENALSEEELSALPGPVAEKINAYIDQKFEEYLTSKALHETSKTQIGKRFCRTGVSFSYRIF